MVEAAAAMKAAGPEDLVRRSEQLLGELKDAQRELQTVREQQAAATVGDLFENAKDVGGIQLITAVLPEMAGDELRTLCDRCKDRGLDKAVMVLAGTSAEKQSVTFACYCTPGAVAAGANAGAIVRQVAAICGGKGGGKPDMAMAGGKDLSKVAEAMDSIPEFLK